MGSSGAGCQPQELCTAVSSCAHGSQHLGVLLTTPDNYSSTVYIPSARGHRKEGWRTLYVTELSTPSPLPLPPAPPPPRVNLACVTRHHGPALFVRAGHSPQLPLSVTHGTLLWALQALCPPSAPFAISSCIPQPDSFFIPQLDWGHEGLSLSPCTAEPCGSCSLCPSPELWVP